MGKRKKRKENIRETAKNILASQKGYYLINPAYPEEIVFSLIGIGKMKSLAAVKGKPEDFTDGKVFKYIEQ